MAKKSIHPLLELHFATFLIAFNGLFAKLISLPASLIVLGRLFFGVLGLAVIMSVLKKKYKLSSKKSYFWSIITGALLTAHWVTYFYSIQVSTVAIGIISVFTFPIIVTFLEPIFFGGKLEGKDVLNAFIVFIGITLLFEKFSLNNVTLGILLGLLSALVYSFRLILTKKHLSKYSSYTTMFYQLLTGTVLLSPLLFFQKITLEGNDLGYIILLGVFFTAVGHSLLLNSLYQLKVKTTSIIMSIQPVYAILLAAVLLGEIPSIKVAIGGAIILYAVVVESIMHAK